jgi:hypothetical protein
MGGEYSMWYGRYEKCVLSCRKEKKKENRKFQALKII